MTFRRDSEGLETRSDGAAENVILNDYILVDFYYVRRSQYTRSTQTNCKQLTGIIRGGEVLPYSDI